MLYISGFTSYTDEKIDILSLKENPKYNQSVIEDLTTCGGLKSFRISEKTPSEMASACVKRFLEKYKIRGCDIDCVIYSTSTLWNEKFSSGDHISNFLIDSKLTSSIPIATFGHGCANFHAALILARNICSSENKNVLIVTTDKAGSQPTRIISPGVSIASDGAACALVSGSIKLEKAYSIESISIRYGAELAKLDPDASRTEYFENVAKGVRSSVKSSLEEIHCKPKDISKVYANHYRKPTIEMFTSLCGFREEQLYLDTLADYAHCFAADPFIMLEHSKPEGGTSLILGTGTQTWASATLTCRD